MGHVNDPFSKIPTFEPPDERGKNSLMAWFDTLLCILGSLTFVLGVWLDGLTPLLAYIGLVSVLMGFIAIKRFERERDMSNH